MSLLVIASVLVSALGLAVAAPSQDATTWRVSVGPTGVEANDASSRVSLSGSGHYIAFESGASNLARGDTNGVHDVFVRDLKTRRTEVVSGSHGITANKESAAPKISASGRYVAFNSAATHLVAADTNHTRDIFVRDRRTGRIDRVNVGPHGRQANAFSYRVSVSATGRYVAFDSEATNLVKNDTNEADDVFVHDRKMRSTERVSVGADGAQIEGDSIEPSISANGRYVAYISPLRYGRASGIWLHDRKSGSTEAVTVPRTGVGYGEGFSPSVSANGRYVAFESGVDVLVNDDPNGRVADVFVRDRQAGETERIGSSRRDEPSGHPAISASGRYIAFYRVTGGEWQVFARDRRLGTTRLVSVALDGAEGNGRSRRPAISGDGRYVGFQSRATNLVTGDANFNRDAFVRGPLWP